MVDENIEKKLPLQLCKDEYRFCVIPDGKRDLKVTEEDALKYNDNILQARVKEGKAYGVMCGYGDLIVIATQVKDICNIIRLKLPETFEVRTAGGATHFYYHCKGVESKMFGNEGELRGIGSYVIGVGTLHYSGNSYTIIKDKPIANITKELIELSLNMNDKHPDLKDAISYFTDYKNLVEQFYNKQPIYYDSGRKWWLWNKNEYRWKLVDETDILNAVDDSLAQASFTTRATTKNEIVEALRRYGRRKQPKPMKPSWVQFKGEIYDVETLEHFPATYEYFAANPIPWKVGETMDTPTIDKLLIDWTYSPGIQDETWANTLLEVIAYSMLSTQPLQRIFAGIGAGANGKGTFVKIIRRFLGEDNIAVTEMKYLTTRSFETSQLYKKLVVLIGEVSEDDMKDTNIIKSLSGEELTRYEFKRADNFKEQSYATCIITTNTLPTTRDRSNGFYRRWLVVDFLNQFPITPNLIEDIPDYEFENLALKCLYTAKGLLENRGFTNEGTMESRATRYEERSNPVGHYIKENYEEDFDSSVSFQEFYKDLCNWLQQHNARKMSGNLVSKLLRNIGYSIEKRNIKIGTGINDSFGKEEKDYSTRQVIFGLKHKQMDLDILKCVKSGEKGK